MISLIGLLVCLAPPTSNPNLDTAPKEASITVIDETGKSHVVTATAVSGLTRRQVKVNDYDKAELEFEGVSLVELLQSQGVPFGKELKGKRAATVALVEAADGYRIALTLLEIDPATTERFVLFADRRNGQPLGEKEGPFRLVIPDDKRQIRWIRMIRTIRIVNLNEK